MHALLQSCLIIRLNQREISVQVDDYSDEVWAAPGSNECPGQAAISHGIPSTAKVTLAEVYVRADEPGSVYGAKPDIVFPTGHVALPYGAINQFLHSVVGNKQFYFARIISSASYGRWMRIHIQYTV